VAVPFDVAELADPLAVLAASVGALTVIEGVRLPHLLVHEFDLLELIHEDLLVLLIELMAIRTRQYLIGQTLPGFVFSGVPAVLGEGALVVVGLGGQDLDVDLVRGQPIKPILILWEGKHILTVAGIPLGEVIPDNVGGILPSSPHVLTDLLGLVTVLIDLPQLLESFQRILILIDAELVVASAEGGLLEGGVRLQGLGLQVPFLLLVAFELFQAVQLLKLHVMLVRVLGRAMEGFFFQVRVDVGVSLQDFCLDRLFGLKKGSLPHLLPPQPELHVLNLRESVVGTLVVAFEGFFDLFVGGHVGEGDLVVVEDQDREGDLGEEAEDYDGDGQRDRLEGRLERLRGAHIFPELVLCFQDIGDGGEHGVEAVDPEEVGEDEEVAVVPAADTVADPGAVVVHVVDAAVADGAVDGPRGPVDQAGGAKLELDQGAGLVLEAPQDGVVAVVLLVLEHLLAVLVLPRDQPRV